MSVSLSPSFTGTLCSAPALSCPDSGKKHWAHDEFIATFPFYARYLSSQKRNALRLTKVNSKRSMLRFLNTFVAAHSRQQLCCRRCSCTTSQRQLQLFQRKKNNNRRTLARQPDINLCSLVRTNTHTHKLSLTHAHMIRGAISHCRAYVCCVCVCNLSA